MQRPMSMNGYSWVEGNTPNLTDASGKQTDLQIPGIMDQGGGGGGILLLLLLIAAAGGSSPGPGGSGNPLLQELAEEINDGICDIRDAAISLFSDTSSSDADTNTDTAENVQPDENTNDDDCFNGQTPQQAALAYATAARAFVTFADIALAGRTGIMSARSDQVVAITQKYENGSCKYHASISNAYSNLNRKIDALNITRRQAYNTSYSSIRTALESAIGSDGHIYGFSTPNVISGTEGHAERMLADIPTLHPIAAMGISKHPCPGSGNEPRYFECSAVMRSYQSEGKIGIIAYWDDDAGIPRIFS